MPSFAKCGDAVIGTKLALEVSRSVMLSGLVYSVCGQALLLKINQPNVAQN